MSLNYQPKQPTVANSSSQQPISQSVGTSGSTRPQHKGNQESSIERRDKASETATSSKSNNVGRQSASNTSSQEKAVPSRQGVPTRDMIRSTARATDKPCGRTTANSASPKKTDSTISHKIIPQTDACAQKTENYEVTRRADSSIVSPIGNATAQPSESNLYDDFMKEHQDIINEYGNIRDKAAFSVKGQKHDKTIDSVFFYSKLIVKAFAICAELHPTAKAVSAGVTAIFQAAETVRQNERIVYGVLLEITDLLCDLFRMREITLTGDDEKAFRVEGLLNRISVHIQACRSDVTSFLAKSTLMKIVLVLRYEDTFKAHSLQFAKLRIEFRDAMALFTADKVTSTSHGVADLQQNIKSLSLRMDQVYSLLRDSTQQQMINHFPKSDDIENCLLSNDHLETLRKISGEHLDEGSLGVLKKELHILQKRIQNISMVLEDVRKDINGIKQYYVRLTLNEDMDFFLQRFFPLRGDVKAGDFAREFANSYKTRLDRNDEDYWMLALVGSKYFEQILDVYDANGSGLIDLAEFNTFCSTRPRGWSIIKWTACWTAGWQSEIYRCHRSITKYLAEAAYQHLLPEFLAFLTGLLQRTAHVKKAQGDDHYKRITGIFAAPRESFHNSLVSRKFVLASCIEVEHICDLRIELWLFSLLQMVLAKWLGRITDQQHTVTGPELDGFAITQKSIMSAYKNRQESLLDSLGMPKSLRNIESFAFGIFADRRVNVSSSSISSTGADSGESVAHPHEYKSSDKYIQGYHEKSLKNTQSNSQAILSCNNAQVSHSRTANKRNTSSPLAQPAVNSVSEMATNHLVENRVTPVPPVIPQKQFLPRHPRRVDLAKGIFEASAGSLLPRSLVVSSTADGPIPQSRRRAQEASSVLLYDSSSQGTTKPLPMTPESCCLRNGSIIQIKFRIFPSTVHPTLKAFIRTTESKLWKDAVNKCARFMMTSQLIAPNSLLLREPLVFNTSASLRQVYTPPNPEEDDIRIGDLGVVDELGDFQPIFNIFDPIMAGHEGLSPERYTHRRYIRQEPYAPLTMHLSDDIKSRVYDNPDHHLMNYEFWRGSSGRRSGAMIVFPHGSFSLKLLPTFFSDKTVIDHFTQYAPAWYNMALPSMGARGYNGALVLVRGVHLAGNYHTAAFLADKSASKEYIQASLRSHTPSPSSFWWDHSRSTNYSWECKSYPTSQHDVNTSENPEKQACLALILSPLELDSSTWYEHFAHRLPHNEYYKGLANEKITIRSESSTFVVENARMLIGAVNSLFSGRNVGPAVDQVNSLCDQSVLDAELFK